MNIQVLYANVGSLANPQPKIIGASFVYDARQEVEYKVIWSILSLLGIYDHEHKVLRLFEC